ncbi:MAG TPA: DUF2703 domain-containing protein [Candidatus Nanoarchaeia archaeon]|nr:DUF2703 domain-containing protein [Candidatus Nanoarchaeia archaeon]
MKIQLLHTADCHAWKNALKELEGAVKELKIKNKIEVMEIKTQEEAEKYKFSASPTIKINNIDIDPIGRKITKFSVMSCRLYFYKGKVYDFPPKEMIIEGIRELEKK